MILAFFGALICNILTLELILSVFMIIDYMKGDPGNENQQ